MKKKIFTPLLIVITLFANSTVFAQGTPPPLTSKVTGIIWQDNKPVDNVRTGSDTGIPGILVKLLDVNSSPQYKVVGSAISNANGEFTLNTNGGDYIVEYTYPNDGFSKVSKREGSDNTVNSAASGGQNRSDQFTIADNATTSDYGLGLVAKTNTITYCTSKDEAKTDWPVIINTYESLFLPKSTVTPKPTKVSLWGAEAANHPIIGIENTGNLSANYNITAGAVATLISPLYSEILTLTSKVAKTGIQSSYDGDTDFLGTSGVSWYNEASAYGTGSPIQTTEDASDIQNTFVGTGNDTFIVLAKGEGSFTTQGGGNQVFDIKTVSSAGVCVVYQYQDGALPVTLKTFKAKKQETATELEWSTTMETNSDRFEIERSSNGQLWNNIGTVTAANESSEVSSYNFLDIKPLSGQNLYRLKMVDTDETFAYSRILNLNFNGKSQLTVYPNPASEKLMVTSASNEEIANIEIYDILGKLKGRSNPSNNYLDLKSLKNGTYLVKVIYKAGHSETQKILVQH